MYDDKSNYESSAKNSKRVAFENTVVFFSLAESIYL